MYNAPLQLNGDITAAYLSAYGSVEQVTQIRSADGTVPGDYVLNVCIDREGFKAISHILI